MKHLLTADVSIRGTRPLWIHHFTPEAIPADGKKEKTGVAGNDPEEWRMTVMMTQERQLYLDPSYIFGCLVGGAVHTKKGRGTIEKNVRATLQVLNDRILIDRFVPAEPIPTDSTLPVYMDIRSVVNPNTRGRNVRYRIAAGSGWSTSYRILWDKTVVSRDEMEACNRDAGALVGVASGRRIGMGRFEVVSFSIEAP